MRYAQLTILYKHNILWIWDSATHSLAESCVQFPNLVRIEPADLLLEDGPEEFFADTLALLPRRILPRHCLTIAEDYHSNTDNWNTTSHKCKIDINDNLTIVIYRKVSGNLFFFIVVYFCVMQWSLDNFHKGEGAS